MLGCVGLAHDRILTRSAGSARSCDIGDNISESANLAPIGVCAGVRQTGLLQFYASGVAARSTARPMMAQNTKRKWIVITLAVAPVSYTHLDVYKRQLSCHSVGGDCFDVIGLGGGRYGFFVGDVSGKGVSAALLATLLQLSLIHI